MIHRYTRALVYFGLLAGMALSLCGCCRTPVRVNVEDFQSRVAVIGRLGVPIGQAVEIEAVVIAGRELGEKAYQSDYLLKVTQVAGRPLTNPPLFRFKTHSWDHVPLAGDTFALYELKTGRKTGSLDDKQITELERGYVASSVRLLAYEEGFFSGIPKHLPRDCMVWQDHGFGYTSYLMVLRDLAPTSETQSPKKTGGN